jgi:hypothetical protein
MVNSKWSLPSSASNLAMKVSVGLGENMPCIVQNFHLASFDRAM